VSRCSGRDIPSAQPVTGSDVFRHESGIHVNALLKDRRSYEPFDVSTVGRPAELTIQAGKHSGSAALIHLFGQQGISLNREEAEELLPLVRARSEKLGRGLSTVELIALR
jgi:homocitrate synthase NifV